MLKHHHRGWARVRESLRRERHVQDLLNRSRSCRLAKRASLSGRARMAWRRTERPIRGVEQAILTLDAAAPDFWTRLHVCEQRLADLYRAAGITFSAEAA